MTRILVFAALQWECRAIVSRLRQVERGRLDGRPCWRTSAAGNEVAVVKTGMGIERAAGAVAACGPLEHFTLVVSAGCAGGLVDALQPGDLVLGTSVSGDGTTCPVGTDAAQRHAARRAAERAGVRSVEGPIVCSAAVLGTVADKRAAAASGAVAVEMEGGPIAAAAAHAGVPFLSARTILDGAEHPLPLPPALMDPERGAVRPLATAAYLAAHPSVIGELQALHRLQQAAAESLRRFFASWLMEDR